MLAYDQMHAGHPFSQLPNPSANAMDCLGQLQHSNSMGNMDAFQAMLAQLQQGDQTLGPAAGGNLSQLLGQLHTPPGLGQLPPGLNPAASSACDLLHAAASSSPLQFDATADSWMHAANTRSGSSSPTTSLPKDQQNPNGPRVFVPDSLKAAAGSSPPTDTQMLLQAALGQQQPALGHAADAANLLPLLQEQLLLQALQQQQTAAAAAQSNIQAALAAALTTGPGMPPGLGHRPLGGPLAAALTNNSTAGNFWPFVPPSLADPTSATAAAATAAALLVTQQQQAAVNQALASAGLLGAATDPNTLLQQLLLSQQQGLAGAAVSSAVNQLQPWAVKALTAQMQQQGAAVNLAAFQQQQMALAGLLNNSTVPSYNNPLPRTTSNTSTQSRRRSCRRSSGTANPDLASSLAGFGAASRANSTAGSDVGAAASSGLPAVLPAGISVKDLCPTKYADTWGADASAEPAATTPAAAAANVAATATSVSSDGSYKLARGSSSASTSSLDSVADAAVSVCGSALSLSSASRQGSGASANSTDDRWQWDSHFCSLEDEAMSTGSSGVEGRACRRAAAAAKAAAKQQQADDTATGKDQSDSKKAAAAAAAVEGVWFPGAREAAGDDSWYLPSPPTCRLFVGNIGCWVDEAMLLAYFGKYGHVEDVQVMWNTKMLARGRRVNREFAFISYRSPVEAARAVHWLDGCKLSNLQKDDNGVTVEYENGEGDSK